MAEHTLTVRNLSLALQEIQKACKKSFQITTLVYWTMQIRRRLMEILPEGKFIASYLGWTI